jgi:ribosomal protein L29
MRIFEDLLRKLIKEEIESVVQEQHPWEKQAGDDDNVTDLLNKLFKLYKQKRTQKQDTADQISDLKRAITRARRETKFKKGKTKE